MIAPTLKPYHPRFQFAVVLVRDQDRSLRFYVDLLGFHLVADQTVPSGGRWIVVEPPDRSVQMALVTPANSDASHRIGAEDTGLVFVTSNLEALYHEWSERGVSFPQSPIETLWRARRAVFQDLDGNRFTILEYGPITEALDTERRAAAEKQEAERLLARELEIARDVQGKLLPQRLPSLRTLQCAAVCIPARHVGGDYYDFLELRQGHTALVLADIAGKGISAALLMANLQANLRAQCATLAGLKEYFPLAPDDFRHLLVSVNRLFHENAGDNGYATLFFGDYDDANRRLSYVNCGHPAPLLLRGGEPFAVDPLESTSTVIGLFNEFECQVFEKQLVAGDTLIIYSDGVTDAMNAAGEEFGEHRLLEIAKAHRHLSITALLDKLLEGLKEFSRPEQADDITLVVAQCCA